MENMLELTKYFHAVVESPSRVDFGSLNAQALKCGWFVPENACTPDAKAFIDSLSVNYNSTFYKKWEDVTTKSRFELFIDQMCHYLTTYGTDFALGNGYVPNDGDIVLTPQEFGTYKVLGVLTPDEMYHRILEAIQSGIALSEVTGKAMVEFISDWVGDTDAAIDEFIDTVIPTVKNREVLTLLCDTFRCVPTQKFDMLRYIIFKTTGKAELIQDRQTIARIKLSKTPFDFSRLSESEMVQLSTIFNRFKNLFCAFKHNPNLDNRKDINTLCRLAKKHHIPFKPGCWETIISTPLYDEKTKAYRFPTATDMESVPTTKLVQLINAILIRDYMAMAGTHRMFTIRNGKAFVDTKTTVKAISTYQSNLLGILRSEVTRRVGMNLTELFPNVRYVKFPAGVSIAAPTSEKNFIGDYPFGTSVDLDDNNYIGVYWRNEWGAHDFDIHALDEKWSRIGWNAEYYDYTDDKTHYDGHGIVYSGDMTEASPEATEILWCKKTCPNLSVFISRYNGTNGSKYRLFVGTEDIKKLHPNYMVNPDSIKWNSTCTSNVQTQMVGVVFDGKFYAMTFGVGEHCVPRINNSTMELFKSMCRVAAAHQKLSGVLPVLNDIDLLSPEQRAEVKPEEILDLTAVSKDTIIGLFK